MKRLEVCAAVRHTYMSLGFKRLMDADHLHTFLRSILSEPYTYSYHILLQVFVQNY